MKASDVSAQMLLTKAMVAGRHITIEQAHIESRLLFEQTCDRRNVPAEKRADLAKATFDIEIPDNIAAEMIASVLLPREQAARQWGFADGFPAEYAEHQTTNRDSIRRANLMWAEATSTVGRQDFSREAMWRLGKFVFDRSFAYASNTFEDGSYVEGAQAFMRQNSNTDLPDMAKDDVYLNDAPEEIKRFWAALNSSETQALFWAIARWYEQACPVIQLASHSYAAALGATSIPSDIDIHIPWRALMVDLPEGLVPSEVTGDIRSVLLHRYVHPKFGDVWSMFLLPRDKRAPFVRNVDVPFANLVEADGDFENDPTLLSPVENLTAEDTRRLAICARIALGACLAITGDPSSLRQTASSKVSMSSSKKRLEREPNCRVYLLGRPIKIDCRLAIKDYILHGKKSRGPLTLQFLVRGHWRNQACGPSHSERRPKWIEPHWKGPEAAMVNVRPHVVCGKPKDK